MISSVEFLTSNTKNKAEVVAYVSIKECSDTSFVQISPSEVVVFRVPLVDRRISHVKLVSQDSL